MDPASCILYVLFLLCSAYFACVETAYTAVNKVRIRTMAEKGDKRASRVLWVCQRFDKTLITILIGNNVFHAACASLSALLVMRQWEDDTYVVYGTIVTTLIVYLFAEMLPKSLGKARSEEIALFFSGSMKLLVNVLTPISIVFSGISALLSKFVSPNESKTVTEEELINLIETIEDEGVLEPEKQALVNSAMEFRNKIAEDIMIPMSDVVTISSGMPLKEMAKLIETLPYSRIPIYEGSKDKIVGILSVNTFLTHYVSGKKIHLRKMLMKPYVFDSKMEIADLLQKMRLNKLHMVFVVDDKQKKIGIITMEDLLEELVGDIQDESDASEGLQLM